MMGDFIKGALKYRYVVIVLIFVFSVLSLFLMRNLRVEGDILEYMPKDDPDVRFFKEIGDKYLSNYFIMLSIEADRDDGVFDKNYLKSIDVLTKAYKDIEGVASVISLTNIMDIKKIEDGIEVRNLVDSDNIDRLTEGDLKGLKNYVLSNDRYVNQIVSKNGRYSQIVIRPHTGSNREEIVNRVEDLTQRLLSGTNMKFYAGGWPVAIRDTNNATMKDLMRLTPIVIVISMLVLFLGFRTIRGVLLPILVVVISNLFVFAIMALLKKPITIGTSAVPVILVSTGTAYAIHIINQYYFHSAKESSKLDIILSAITDKWKAVLLSALTTMVGFITLVTATLTTVVDLGVFMTLGIFFAFVMAILVVPMILMSLGVKRAKKVLSEEEALSSHSGIFLPFVERLVFNHPKKVVFVFAILSVVLLPTLYNLTADVNPINYFREDAPIRKSEQLLVDYFGGAVPVYVLIKGDVKDPRVMYVTEYLEREIEAVDMVSSSQSVASVVADLNYNLIGDYNIPESSGKIGNLWFFVEGNEYLNQFVTQEMNESVILARIESLQKSYVTHANGEIKGIISKIPKRYRMINRSELSQDRRDALREYFKGHIVHRIETELRIANKDIDRDVIIRLVDSAMNTNNERSVSKEPYCEALNREFEKRFQKIEKEYGVNYRFREDTNKKRCALKDLLDFDLISGKVILSENEIENDLADEIRDFKEQITLYSKILTINSMYDEAFSQKNISAPTKKRILGVLNLATRDMIVIGDDFKEFDSLSGESLNIDANYGGLGPVLTMLNDNLMKNQIQSIVLAIILVFLLMLYLTRSYIVGLISMIPICFTLLVDFSIMAIFNLPIDDVTIVIASILIGVGIDYTIHTITGLRLGYEKFKDDTKAISFTIRVIGRAVFLNTSAVALGFIALMFGDFLPLRTMGLLTAITMFIAATSAIVMIPTFALIYKRFNIKEVKL